MTALRISDFLRGRHSRKRVRLVACLLAVGAFAVSGRLGRAEESPAAPGRAAAPIAGVNELSLADLLSLDLSTTVASKSAESLVRSSGTVYVITEEDIRRYGWRTLRQILSSLPNVDIYYDGDRVTGGQRGFAGEFSGTLLMIDGREVQSLETSATDIADSFAVDRIARIEILQGPNAMLYGANAKEGVINIITKLVDPGQADELSASILSGSRGTLQAGAVLRKTEGHLQLGLAASVYRSDNKSIELARFLADDAAYSRAGVSVDSNRYQGFRQIHLEEHGDSVDAHMRYRFAYAGLNYAQTVRRPGVATVSLDYGATETQREYIQSFVGLAHTRSNLKSHVSDELSGFVEAVRTTESDRRRYSVWSQMVSEQFSGTLNSAGYDATRNQVRSQITNSACLFDRNLCHQLLLTYDYQHLDHIMLAQTQGRLEPLVGVPSREWANVLRQLPGFGTWTTHSTSAQGALMLFDSRVKLTGGINWYKRSFVEDHLSPRLSLVLSPTEQHAVKITWGKAFRPLNAAEFVAKGDRPAQETDLLEVNLTSSGVLGRLSLLNTFAAYRMRGDRLAPAEGQHAEALRTVTVRGLEEQLKAQYLGWSGFIGGRWAHPDYERVAGEWVITDIPQYRAKLGLSRDVFWWLQASLMLDVSSKVQSGANRGGGSGTEVLTIPAWTLLNANLNFGEFRVWDLATTVSVYAENVLDSAQFHPNVLATSPVQFKQAPRSIYAEARFRF